MQQCSSIHDNGHSNLKAQAAQEVLQLMLLIYLFEIIEETDKSALTCQESCT